MIFLGEKLICITRKVKTATLITDSYNILVKNYFTGNLNLDPEEFLFMSPSVYTNSHKKRNFLS